MAIEARMDEAALATGAGAVVVAVWAGRAVAVTGAVTGCRASFAAQPLSANNTKGPQNRLVRMDIGSRGGWV